MTEPYTVRQYRKFFAQRGISHLEIKAQYGDLRLNATWKKAYSEYTYERLPIISAIAELERPQPQPQPKPQPKPKLPPRINVASVLAKLEKSSSTLDLGGDGNISSLTQNDGKVLSEELVINLGASYFRPPEFRPVYCQSYTLLSTPCTSDRRLLVVSTVPISKSMAFCKHYGHNNFVNICRARPPPA